MDLNTHWKYTLLPGVSGLNPGCRLPLGHPQSVVPCSQILLLLWCDKFRWFCPLVLNNFQRSADDTSITSFHYFFLASTKMSKKQCSLQFSNVTAKLGLRFLETEGWRSRGQFQVVPFFLHVPIQTHFLRSVSKPINCHLLALCVSWIWKNNKNCSSP